MENNDTRKDYMFNHGVFKEILQNKLDELWEKRHESTDPYEQMCLDSSRKIVESLFRHYKIENISKIVENMNAHNGMFNHGLYREYLVKIKNDLALTAFHEGTQYRAQLNDCIKKEINTESMIIIEGNRLQCATNQQILLQELIDRYDYDVSNQNPNE
mgnify:CR=1 FL=1